ncbi:neurotransmitter:Na+ symporter, NSS family [Reichenbachiella faecimaris]|uniref:Neurotransmitter:Na+ symporter, NSS family n=1 Tax=Reichenbachiella faecimaris TaxID=692418 RepID=A0A1W2G8M9_REIFA|nr:sodium-dependent transporter [Reichenbachiella faecimaris]SMD32854.1 neurotransmitter:Na+ symporter, NSS family [Reichenbachiella faecimaris]
MAARGNFSSRIGFIAAAAGSAVGLGNIWGFPYEAGAGGGAIFVLVYLFFCFALCFPVMLTELAIGRKSGRNAVGAFDALGHKKWNFIGKLGVLSGALILSFYNVIAGWAFGYTFEMASGNFAITEHFKEYTTNIYAVGIYGFLFMVSTAFIVSKGVSGGIEKAAKILMPSLIVMMVSLILYSLFLPNAMAGIKFFLLPDFTKLTLSVAFNAMGQAFFSLSLGMGTFITYGSYISKNDNLVSSAALITLTDVGIAIIAGLMIFPLIGFISGGTLSGVGRGPELIFVTLPHIFGEIGPTAGSIVGMIFFSLLCFAALTSTVSLLEVPVSYVIDEFKISRKKAAWLMSGIVYLIGIPSLMGNGYSAYFSEFITYVSASAPTDFLSFIVNVANDSFLPLGGALMIFFAAHIWKRENLEAEISMGFEGYEKSWVRKYLRFVMPILLPATLIIMFSMIVLVTFFGM